MITCLLNGGKWRINSGLPREIHVFFIPNRLFVQDNEMYVSFNIAGIPSDMEVTSMILYVPLPEVSSEVRLDLHEIVAAWDEQSVTHVRPVYTQARSKGYFCSETKEGSFALEHLAHPWRSHSLENHGVYVRVHSLIRYCCPKNTRPTSS